MRFLYALFGLIVLLGWAWAAWNGQELRTQRRQFVPMATVRGQQGGTGAIWYRGYHGGK